MTNFQRWQFLMKDVTSPQSWVDFGFYYLIAASLQRRVWTGPLHRPLFPNIYVIFCGPPGTGKNLVISPIAEMLRHFKLENPAEKAEPEAKVDSVDPAIIEAINAANYAQATQGNKGMHKYKSFEKQLLIPVAADAVTYEALVHAMGKATRRINYKEWNELDQKNIMKIYTHSSLCFCLEEISSLFRRKTEDVVNFLIKVYDCGDYEYVTKTQGEDMIRRACLNFLGGTTPSFMETTFDDGLLNDGFSSRAWFLYESSNRFNTLRFPELTGEQLAAKAQLRLHVKKLTELYGPVALSTEAEEYLEDWWVNVHPKTKPNNSPKLEYYYARKNIHVKKLAMAIHFGEDAERNDLGFPLNPISKAECVQAMGLLDVVEKKMHYALNFEGKNPLAAVSRRVIRYIAKNGGQSTVDLSIEFFDDVNVVQLNEILNHLVTIGKITLNKDLGKWELKGKRDSEPEPTSNNGHV